MKPIHKPNIKDSARTVQQLFPTEISDFVVYLKKVADETSDDQEELVRVWGKQYLAVGFWIDLSRRASTINETYQKDATQQKTLFVGRLCKGKLFLFTFYYLCEYIQQEDHSEKFAHAVKLFFNTEQFSGE